MKQWQVLRTVFPEVITENFEFTDYVEEADRLWNIGAVEIQWGRTVSCFPADILQWLS